MTTLQICLFSLACSFSSALNIDTKFPIIFTPPQQTSPDTSYFGFNVQALRGKDDFRFIIGAPNDTSDFYGAPRTGAIYLCGRSGDIATCIEINLHFDARQRLIPVDINNTMHEGMWLGGAIATQGDKSSVVSCAHAWANHESAFDPANDYLTSSGRCFYFDIPQDDAKNIVDLFPLSAKADRYITRRGQNDQRKFAYANSGFSVAFSKSGRHLVIGAPGTREWKGTVVEYDISRGTREGLKRDNERKLDFDSFRAPIQQYSYLGYSVAPGQFGSDEDSQAAIGCPRRLEKPQGIRSTPDYTGNVIMKVLPFSGPPYDSWRFLTGTLFDYLGATVIAVDLNQDGLDDIIAGAPLFSNNARERGDIGRIYVYVNQQKAKTQTIDGHVPGGRFGSALADIGDINLDGFNDVAVGAPYENIRGAVYIYLGQADGLNRNFHQKISASDDNLAAHHLMGFGISIAGRDVDGNDYPDLLIGSYLSGRAVLFRTNPIVRIETELTSDVDLIDISRATARVIPLKYCLHIIGKSLAATQNLRIRIDSDVLLAESGRSIRATFMNGTNRKQYNEMATVATNQRVCSPNVLVNVAADPDDKITPLNFTLSLELANEKLSDNNRIYCEKCPVLLESRNASREFPFVTGCDGKCKSQITVVLSAHVDFTGSAVQEIVQGDVNTLILKVNVQNTGQNSYNTKIRIRSEPEMEPTRLDKCVTAFSNDKKFISCNAGNPLKESAQITLVIPFDLSNLQSTASNITFYATLSTVSDLLPGSETDVSQFVSVERLANSVVVWKRNAPQFLYDHHKARSKETVKFYHLVDVTKEGPSPVQEIKVLFRLPAFFKYDGNEPGKPFIYNPTFTISPDSIRITCDKVDGLAALPAEADDNSQDDTETSGEQFQPKPLETRKGREASDDRLPVAFPAVANKTKSDLKGWEIGCSNVTCITVRCVLGPFNAQKHVATITLSTGINMTLLESQFGKHHPAIDILVRASSKILDKSVPQEVGSTDEAPIALRQRPFAEPASLYVYAVGSGVGFLLLVILLVILVKIGFFKRQKKEELQKLITEHKRATMMVQPAMLSEGQPSAPQV